MWKTYAQGYKDGQLQALQQFERVLAVCREEMADLRRDRDAQLARADAAVDLLLGHLGTRAITPEGRAATETHIEHRLQTVERLTRQTDPEVELPYGDPEGRYASPAEASFFADEAGGYG